MSEEPMTIGSLNRRFRDGVERLTALGVESAHLRIETYFLNEIQHVKDHLFSMLELCLPENHTAMLNTFEDWEVITRSFDGQFSILRGSLNSIRSQIGEENFSILTKMSDDLESLLLSGNGKAAAALIHNMDKLGWKKKPKPKVE